jgi:predicted RND superfamily exporter protein
VESRSDRENRWDLVKEIHRALNEGSAAHYAIPGERDLVAQELLLFETAGSDDLQDVADTRFSTARVTLKVPWVDAAFYPRFLSDLEREVAVIFGDGAEIRVTGYATLLGRILAAIVASTVQSYGLATLAIVPMMILTTGSLGRGLLSMIPNLTPVVLTLGLMGWVDTPVEAASLLIGSIILGLAVDDTIHFMLKFQDYYAENGDLHAAVRETLVTTGSAMVYTTLALAAGFFSFTVAQMSNIAAFGALTGFAALVALLADLLLAPALLSLVLGGERREVPARA